MTLSAYEPSSYDTGNSVTDFDFTFPCFSSSEVVVTLRDISTGTPTTLTETTDYSVSLTGSGDPYTGGTVTTVETYETGYILLITRSTTQTQLTDYQASGNFPSDTTEDQFDKLVQMVQELQATVDRCIKLPIGDKEAENYAAGYATLDDSVSRAGGYQGFDADTGAPEIVTGILADEVTVSSLGEDIVNAANEAAARSLLGLGTGATLDSDTDGTLAADSDNNIPTQKAVKTYVDTVAVPDTGNSTIAGDKTFTGTTDFSTSFPTTPESAPTTDYQAANKKYVDDNAEASAKLSGDVVQVVYVLSTAEKHSTDTIPLDDTKPQWSEGLELSSLQRTVTATAIDNILRVDVVAVLDTTANIPIIMALFKGTDTDASSAVISNNYGGMPGTVCLTYYMTASATTPLTFKVRAGGSSASTTTFNGSNSARIFGGVAGSSMTITEIQA